MYPTRLSLHMTTFPFEELRKALNYIRERYVVYWGYGKHMMLYTI